MTKTLLELNANAAPIDKQRAEELFHDSPYVFRLKVKGIREQIKKGRYSRYAIIDDKKIMVNYYVYYDYCVHRKMLEDKYASTSAPPFDVGELAKITPVSVLHHFAG